MRMTLGAIGLAIGLASASAFAASSTNQVNLTQNQKQMIQQDLANQTSEKAPANFKPTVGQKAPDQLSFSDLPDQVTNQFPSLKDHQFAKLANGNIVIADQNKQIVAVIG